MSTATAPSPTHVELLGLVRDIQAAAVASDAMQLAEVVQRLRDQLERHVAAERHDYGALPSAVQGALSSGQERLLSLVENLDDVTCQDSARPCVVRVAELAALLRRQAGIEQRATHLLDLGRTGERGGRAQ